jgi:hypothetical protein
MAGRSIRDLPQRCGRRGIDRRRAPQSGAVCRSVSTPKNWCCCVQLKTGVLPHDRAGDDDLCVEDEVRDRGAIQPNYPMGGLGLGYNGSTWDRLRTVGTGILSTASVAATATGYNPGKLASAASTNGTNIKASARERSGTSARRTATQRLATSRSTTRHLLPQSARTRPSQRSYFQPVR